MISWKIVEKRKCRISDIKVTPDHVHMLICILPQEKIPDVVKQLKGASSRYLFREFPKH